MNAQLKLSNWWISFILAALLYYRAHYYDRLIALFTFCYAFIQLAEYAVYSGASNLTAGQVTIFVIGIQIVAVNLLLFNSSYTYWMLALGLVLLVSLWSDFNMDGEINQPLRYDLDVINLLYPFLIIFPLLLSGDAYLVLLALYLTCTAVYLYSCCPHNQFVSRWIDSQLAIPFIAWFFHAFITPINSYAT